MKRREFLIALALATGGGSFRASAFPIGRLLGPGNERYVPAYLERLYAWYRSTWFDFSKAMTPDELRFVNLCVRRLGRWGFPLSRDQAFDFFQLSHRVESNVIRHGRLAIAVHDLFDRSATGERLDSTTSDLIGEIAKMRGAKFSDHHGGRLFGLGWDFDRDHFKVYRLHIGAEDVLSSDLRSLQSGVSASLLAPRLSCVTYRKGRVVDTKMIFAHAVRSNEGLRRVPFADAILSTVEIRRTSGAREWFFRLNGFHLAAVSAAGHPAAMAHQNEFAQLLDSIVWRDRDNYTLYYP